MDNNDKRLFVRMERCLGCRTCELRCAVERGSVGKTLFAAVRECPLPRRRVYVLPGAEGPQPVQCRHCDDAPCLSVCPTGALYRDEKTGCVGHDAERCLGCWMCVMACPLGMIAAAVEKSAADKCDRCFQMERPACAAACPTGAICLMTPVEYEKELAARRMSFAACPEVSR